MNSNDTNDKIYFNQNMIYFKDKIYNSAGSLEISFSNSTTDFKTFSTPSLYIAVIGENNLRRMCNLSYVDSVDLYSSIKDVISNIRTIYTNGNSNVLIKKYQFDRTLKFEFIKINNGDEVVSISVIHSNSDFTKVVVPYSVFFSFSVGILKYFVNEYVKISFMFTNRNLLTQILEENKQIKNGIITLPSSLVYSENSNLGVSPQVPLEQVHETAELNNDISETINDFDNFLGKDMENIKVPDLENKSLVEEKTNNSEITSPLINKTLNRDLSVLESMITASITKPDPMITLFEGFRRSMNLDDSFSFLPNIPINDLKSLLYISKIYHDMYLNYYTNNYALPSIFQILKYKVDDLNKIDYFNIQLSYDLLLIIGYMKIFRSKMESRESDGNLNGSIFYMRLRTFLDPLIYSFLDETKGKIISNIICSNFEKYNNVGFFKHYQDMLESNNFEKITINDIRNFSEELNEKVFKAGILSVNINDKHNELFDAGFLKINHDNNLNIEQITNELVPLEVFEKIGVDVRENSPEMVKIIENIKISKEILDIFYNRVSENKKIENTNKKEQQSNLSKVVRFFNDEVPIEFRDEFYKYVDEEVKLENYDFKNEKIKTLELGENIIKSIYVWNESDNKKEPYTTYRTKLEECILTKDLIIAKYESNINEEDSVKEEWNLDFL